MNAHKLVAIALAALLVFAGGAAALPSQASGADAADNNQPDDPDAAAADTVDENATDGDENVTDADENETDADDARDENASAGPPTEMPEQAPDHVTQIHDLIRSKLNGALTGQELGEAISDVMGNDSDAEDQADTAAEQSENASDTSEDAQSNVDNAGPSSDLPEQTAGHVSAIHETISSWLNGDSDGNPGEAVSSTAA